MLASFQDRHLYQHSLASECMVGTDPIWSSPFTNWPQAPAASEMREWKSGLKVALMQSLNVEKAQQPPWRGGGGQVIP